MNTKPRSNKIIKFCGTTLLSLFILANVPLTSYAQSKGKLDVVSYSIPSGFTTQNASSSAARGFIKKYPGGKSLGVILYASAASSGNADTDFSQRWQQLFGDTAKDKSVPQAQKNSSEGVTILSGAGAISYQGGNAVAVLTTLTVNGRLITITGVADITQGISDYQAFIGGIELDDALVNQTANSTTNPQISSKKPNVARSQSAGTSSIVGRWRHYIYSGGYYVRGQYAGTGRYVGRNETAVIDYTFNSDGTFKVLIPKSNAGSGTYQATGNTLKMTYSNGTVKRYSYAFEEHPETIYRYLLLTEIGSAQSFPRLQSEGNK
jgi:hypothetical protein